MCHFQKSLDGLPQTLRRATCGAIADLEGRSALAGQKSEADLDNRSRRTGWPDLLARYGGQSMIIRMGAVASLVLLAGCSGLSRSEASVCVSGRGKGVLGVTCERSTSIAPSESGSLTSKP